jgi:hypothetical protein
LVAFYQIVYGVSAEALLHQPPPGGYATLRKELLDFFSSYGVCSHGLTELQIAAIIAANAKIHKLYGLANLVTCGGNRRRNVI